ncbi:DUF4062 domain-containing protein [Paenibacillus alkaliterrae]
MMFERNFGAWDSSVDPAQKCINTVRESDIFLLFISEKSGTFYEAPQRTITHMEFIEAFNKRKTILVFVEKSIKDEYFAKAKRLINEYIENHKEETQSFPSAAEMIIALEASELTSNVDPYIWFFIDDIVKRGLYFETLNLAVAPNWKEYFSDLLRRGVTLLPAKETLEANEEQLDRYDKFHDIFTAVIPHVKISGFHDLKILLEIFQKGLTAGTVIHDYGYTQETIGTFSDCNAVTLYEFQNDRLVLKERSGSATGGEPFYRLDNRDSYVALTYKNLSENENQIFFKEANRTFYLCLRLPLQVMTFHFPCGSDWDTDKFIAFKEYVQSVIIDKNAMVIDLVRKLIGGLQP